LQDCDHLEPNHQLSRRLVKRRHVSDCERHDSLYEALNDLSRDVAALWGAYQASRFGYVTARLPGLLARAQAATETHDGDDGALPRRQLGLSYQLAAVQLTKLGEAELAWIAADRGPQRGTRHWRPRRHRIPVPIRHPRPAVRWPLPRSGTPRRGRRRLP